MKDHEEVVDAWRDDFRVAYEEDSRNAARQSFDELGLRSRCCS